MKSVIALVLFLALTPAAFAGWGAIAYDSNSGRSAEAHGYGSLEEAEATALNLCGDSCTILNWEHEQCNALATGNGRYGESHGYLDGDSAIAAAIAQCGDGCAMAEWICR